MSSVNFLVKMRDAATMIADACNEELEKKAPVVAKIDAKDSKDFDRLPWIKKEGTKAAYEQTTKEANQNNEVFQTLQQILADKKGFWQSSTHKYWVHQGDVNVIDRRKK
ncbi:MAG: hypothetical protein JSV12_00930 [Candidatus Bathyarchaeota archaeon]|nr:MAG: hypothetical protein JSV12_00930 [Candidatus Bathyarchaeota archaeon]